MKLLTAEEVASGGLGQIAYLNQELDRVKMWVKKDLADRGKIVLHNVAIGEDEILYFNCHLCEKVGNCDLHKGTYIIGDCHHLEYGDRWEEVG